MTSSFTKMLHIAKSLRKMNEPGLLRLLALLQTRHTTTTSVTWLWVKTGSWLTTKHVPILLWFDVSIYRNRGPCHDEHRGAMTNTGGYDLHFRLNLTLDESIRRACGRRPSRAFPRAGRNGGADPGGGRNGSFRPHGRHVRGKSSQSF